MTPVQIFITLGGIALSLFIAWFFWLAPKGQTRVKAGAGGVQEVAITVKGGYTPDIIVVKAGQPLRMRFTRQESSTCSEMVLFPEGGVLHPEGLMNLSFQLITGFAELLRFAAYMICSPL